MIKRKCIGPVHSPYPARRVSENVGFLVFKFISAVVSVMLWLGVYMIILFVATTVMGGSSDEGPKVQELFDSNIGQIVFYVVAVAVFFGVMRSKIGSRNNRKNKNEKKLL